MRAILIFSLFILLFGCRKSDKKVKSTIIFDTSVALKLALEKAYSDSFLEGYESNLYRFKDTILFESNPLLLSYFPKMKFKSKLISKDRICGICASNKRNDSRFILGFHIVTDISFYRSDTSYLIRFTNGSIFCTMDNKGNRINTPKGIYDGNDNCEYGFARNNTVYSVTFNDGKYEVKCIHNDWGI